MPGLSEFPGGNRWHARLRLLSACVELLSSKGSGSVSLIGASRRPSPVMSISTWATALLLVGTTALTFAEYRGNYRLLVPSCIVLCAIVGAAAIARAMPAGQVTVTALFKWSPLAVGRLMSQLSPVIFLSLAYPLAAERLSTIDVGGLPFPRLLLATSITAPWLSQIVC